jgi:alanine racemase
LKAVINYWKGLIKVQVDITAFKNNLAIIRDHIGPQTKLIFVAKSASYGLGKEMVQYGKDAIDGIAVDSLHTALQHAFNGFEKEIYVLSPLLPQSLKLLPQIYKNGKIISCVDSLSLVHLLRDRCLRENQTLQVAVKVNWGLNRFGIEPAQLPEMMNFLDDSPLEVDSIYTHLSGTTNSPVAKLRQKEKKFLELVKDYRNQGIKIHIADSACTVRGIGTHLDFVRTGLLALGIDPVELPHKPLSGLKLCFKLLSTVLHTSEVKKGQELGYRNIVQEDKKVAVILGGYAHGLPRDAIAAGNVIISGIPCPYACKSFMEYAIVDISISEACHPFDLAAAANNIPEIFFTALSHLIQREYVFQ